MATFSERSGHDSDRERISNHTGPIRSIVHLLRGDFKQADYYAAAKATGQKCISFGDLFVTGEPDRQKRMAQRWGAGNG